MSVRLKEIAIKIDHAIPASAHEKDIVFEEKIDVGRKEMTLAAALAIEVLENTDDKEYLNRYSVWEREERLHKLRVFRNSYTIGEPSSNPIKKHVLEGAVYAIESASEILRRKEQERRLKNYLF